RRAGARARRGRGGDACDCRGVESVGRGGLEPPRGVARGIDRLNTKFANNINLNRRTPLPPQDILNQIRSRYFRKAPYAGHTAFGVERIDNFPGTAPTLSFYRFRISAGCKLHLKGRTKAVRPGYSLASASRADGG